MPTQLYNISELQKKVRDAAADFIRQDAKLLELEAHEQALSHRIAIYLEGQFKREEEFNFDCEYSKHLRKAKRMDIELFNLQQQERELLICGCSACKDIPHKKKLDNKLFRPDIVVHSRDNDDRNMIVIEIKNTEKFCPFDGAKLKALTAPKTDGKTYEYQLGVFLSFKGNEPLFKWFSKGDALLE